MASWVALLPFVSEHGQGYYTDVEHLSTNISTRIEGEGFSERLKAAFGTEKPADIARKLSITYQGAKNYLSGRIPSPETLVEISRSTGCSIDWLLTGRGAKVVTFGMETGEGSKQLSDDNGKSSQPHLQRRAPDSEVSGGSEERVMVAHMQLIIQQNNRIIEQNELAAEHNSRIVQLLEQMVNK